MAPGELSEDPSAEVDVPARGPAGPGAGPPPPSPFPRRVAAAGEVVLCSGFPTQLTLVVLFGLLGAGPTDGSGALSLGYVVTLSLIDAALVLALVWLLMRAHGEHPVATLAGGRPFRSEALLGLALAPAALVVVAAAFAILSRVAPELRNVPENPLEALITTPAARDDLRRGRGGRRRPAGRGAARLHPASFPAAPRRRSGRTRGVQRGFSASATSCRAGTRPSSPVCWAPCGGCSTCTAAAWWRRSSATPSSTQRRCSSPGRAAEDDQGATRTTAPRARSEASQSSISACRAADAPPPGRGKRRAR